MSKEIHDEIMKEALDDNSSTKKRFGPLYVLFGLLLLILLLALVIPYHLIDLSPEPRGIPSMDDLQVSILDNVSRPQSVDIRDFVLITPVIKQLSNKIVVESCPEYDKLCYSKALYYFVRDNIQYVGEQDEYYQVPEEVLSSRGGDCDDYAILLASMQQSIGIPIRFIRIQSHVYIQGYIKDAPRFIKTEDLWINMDATCSNCDYGKIPYQNEEKIKEVIW